MDRKRVKKRFPKSISRNHCHFKDTQPQKRSTLEICLQKCTLSWHVFFKSLFVKESEVYSEWVKRVGHNVVSEEEGGLKV
jgi:hypothetical protein